MDQSELDKSYFLTKDTYNCPFCKRGSVGYSIKSQFSFNWSVDREVHGYRIMCGGCNYVSLHLSDFKFFNTLNNGFFYYYKEDGDQTSITESKKKLDDLFFYHQPSSFFTIDSRIPKSIRELITEADGCLKMNFLVGSSGSLRKAIYEFVKDQKATGQNYEEKIKNLKTKHPYIYEGYFDILANVQDMTSENLHEQEGSWEPWGANDLRFIITTVKEVLQEVYVTPKDKAGALKKILELKKKSTLKNIQLEEEPEEKAK